MYFLDIPEELVPISYDAIGETSQTGYPYVFSMDPFAAYPWAFDIQKTETEEVGLTSVRIKNYLKNRLRNVIGFSLLEYDGDLMVVRFVDRKHATDFIDKLNEFLRVMHKDSLRDSLVSDGRGHGFEFKVLDHGFVRLVDVMGDDAAIVQAARVAYGPGTKSIREDGALIDHLWRNRHTSPFEMVEFKFHCKMPIFCARQWIRHRTANVNEMSGRYSVLPEEFYVPDVEDIRKQSKHNKQGRSEEGLQETDHFRECDEIPIEGWMQVHLRHEAELAFVSYNQRLETGLARELARINLPLSTYTSWYWKIDLKNLLHFLSLRLDPHAQWEMQQYAKAIARIVKSICPLTWESFERHTLFGCNLPEEDVDYILLVMGNYLPAPDYEKAHEEILKKLKARHRKMPLYNISTEWDWQRRHEAKSNLDRISQDELQTMGVPASFLKEDENKS